MAWVDVEPALLVSYHLTHPLRGWGVVDERRTETVDRVVTRQSINGRENLATLRVPRTAAATWRVLCSSVRLLLPSVLSLNMCSTRYVVVVSLAHSFQVSATSSEGRRGRFFFYFSFFSPIWFFAFCFSFVRFLLLPLFHRMGMPSYPVR